MGDPVDEMLRRLSSADLVMGDDDDDDDGADQVWMAVGNDGSDTLGKTKPRKVATTKQALGFDPKAKTVAHGVKTTASLGVTTATQITNFTGGAAGVGALVGGATLSAGPIGLLIASAALTLASTGTKAVSAKKTHDHIKALEKIRLEAGSLTCDHNHNEHKFILETSLPYIIAKKKKKRFRKVGGAVPVIGATLESVRAATKAGMKWAKGTRGKNRHFHAEKIAVHHTRTTLLRRVCPLTTAIIAELFGVSTEDAALASSVPSDQLATVISIKMKSV